MPWLIETKASNMHTVSKLWISINLILNSRILKAEYVPLSYLSVQKGFAITHTSMLRLGFLLLHANFAS